jgi:hypothetical protein
LWCSGPLDQVYFGGGCCGVLCFWIRYVVLQVCIFGSPWVMAGLGAKQQFEELGWSVYREERVGDPRFLVVGSWSDQVCSKEGGWRSVLLDQVGDFAFLELHGFCGSDGGGLYEFWVKSSLVAGD